MGGYHSATYNATQHNTMSARTCTQWYHTELDLPVNDNLLDMFWIIRMRLSTIYNSKLIQTNPTNPLLEETLTWLNIMAKKVCPDIQRIVWEGLCVEMWAILLYSTIFSLYCRQLIWTRLSYIKYRFAPTPQVEISRSYDFWPRLNNQAKRCKHATPSQKYHSLALNYGQKLG